MKKLIYLLLLLVMVAGVLAIPQTFNIHGKLTDSSNQPLTGTYNMTFRIYDNYTSGNLIWNQTNMSVSTDSDGVYNVILEGINANFTQQFFLSVEVQSDGEMDPRINLTSTPYAFRAQNVTVAGVEFSSNVDIGANNFSVDTNVLFVDSDGDKVGIGTASPSEKLHIYVSTGNVRTLLESGNAVGESWIKGATQGVVSLFDTGAGADVKEANLVSNDGVFSIRPVNDARSVAINAINVDLSNGNVGIGTTSPSDELVVNGTFRVLNETGTEGLFVGQNGNVGIGTGAPNDALTILPAVSAGGLTIRETDDGGDTFVVNSYVNSATMSMQLDSVPKVFLTVSGDTYFTGGNVGIGTTGPEALLHTSEDGVATSGNFLSGTTPTSLITGAGQNIIQTIGMAAYTANLRPILQFRRARGTLDSLDAVQNNDLLGSFSAGGYDGDSTEFPTQIDFIVDGDVSDGSVPARISFLTGTVSGNRTERMVVKSDGNVGIGTTAPGAKLEVDGGDLIMNGTATNHLVLAQNQDAVTPTLAFGNGNTGFYQVDDGSLYVSVAGAAKWFYTAGNSVQLVVVEHNLHNREQVRRFRQ